MKKKYIIINSTKNLLHKLLALCLGYATWVFFTASQPVDTWISVPIGFYNTDTHFSYSAPSTLSLCISGSRNTIQNLIAHETMLHIDGRELQKGQNYILVSADKLLLPRSVSVIHCNPSLVAVYVKDAEDII